MVPVGNKATKTIHHHHHHHHRNHQFQLLGTNIGRRSKKNIFNILLTSKLH